MIDKQNLIEDTLRILLVRYSEFAGEIASAKIEYRSDLKYKTAATDGKDIFIDPDYFASLDEEGRAFLLAHEFMHKKLKHHLRRNFDGVERDPDLFNEAADAVTNANLERDGFTLPKGCVNRSEARNYTVEEFYEILKKEDKNNSDDNNTQVKDDHSMWEETLKESEEKGEIPDVSKEVEMEKEGFQKNRETRLKKAKEKLERMKEEVLKKQEEFSDSEKIIFENVGEENQAIDWKILLRREFFKDDYIWSQRRSIAENNYAYRLEEYEEEDEAETEVLIDVSGSVDLDLVKSFLRIVKPIIDQSKLKVGCFNAKFWGFVEIESVKDIDHFVIPSGARGSSSWTEDWDLAVRSFSKKKEVNKIIFTDGYPGPGNMPKEDLKNENVIWVVYGNKDFHPCCGKVIFINEKQLNQLHAFNEKRLGR